MVLMRVKNFASGLFLSFLVLSLSLYPKLAIAFGNTEGNCDKTKGAGDWLDTAFGCINIKSNPLGNFTSQVYAYALFLGATLAVIMIVLGGVQYITSSGSPDAVTSAKSRITSALWGMAILILAAILFRTIGVTGP